MFITFYIWVSAHIYTEIKKISTRIWQENSNRSGERCLQQSNSGILKIWKSHKKSNKFETRRKNEPMTDRNVWSGKENEWEKNKAEHRRQQWSIKKTEKKKERS